MKNDKSDARVSREAFLKFRQELSRELGVFSEPEKDVPDAHAREILRRMAKSEKKHRRKRR
ncbi:MAG: hypothetical protein IKD89_03970 [Clostridia bacterium]|nr:hypothetical protein [Clostridia bacterium]